MNTTTPLKFAILGEIVSFDEYTLTDEQKAYIGYYIDYSATSEYALLTQAEMIDEEDELRKCMIDWAKRTVARLVREMQVVQEQTNA